LLERIGHPLIFLGFSLLLHVESVRTFLFPWPQSGRILEAIIVFLVIVLMVRTVDGLLQGWHSRRRRAFPLPRVLHGSILGVMYAVVLLIVLKEILQINITPFLATSAILTMILGLAFQDVLSNILSGVSLHLTKSFGKGDWIGVGDREGVVMDTNWRETRILDRRSNMVVIPNNAVASERVINYSRPEPATALMLPLKIAYDASPSTVYDALCEAAVEVPEVMDKPAPQAFIEEFDDVGISYTLKFWVRDFENKYPILGEVGRKIWFKFKRRGIEIPIPLGDKLGHVIRSFRIDQAEASIENARDRKTKILMSSPLLRYPDGEQAGEPMVSEEEIRALASVVRSHRFAAGEILFKQGDKGESCYVVARGRILGTIVYEEKGRKYSSEFHAGPGGIFGEMSLFTGMPRTATGVIEEDAELLEVKADDFGGLLKRNPALADVIAELVSERNRSNQEFLCKIKELSEKDISDGCSKRSIRERLKKLFRV